MEGEKEIMSREQVIQIIRGAQENVSAARAIDRRIDRLALGSHREHDVLRVIQRIVQLRRKKEALIEKALRVKRMMQQLKPENYKLLVYTVARELQWKDVKDKYPCSERTFYRRRAIALDKLGKIFESKGAERYEFI